MWSKDQKSGDHGAPRPAAAVTPHRAPAAGASRIVAGSRVEGSLSGGGDLFVAGSFEGSIRLPGRRVVVEAGGRVVADIVARDICVAGRVDGDLRGSDQVTLLATGRVEGNIHTKSLTLETGAHLKGSVDMESVRPVPAPAPEIEPVTVTRRNSEARVAGAG